MKTFLEIVDSSIINLAEMATNKIIKVSPSLDALTTFALESPPGCSISNSHSFSTDFSALTFGRNTATRLLCAFDPSVVTTRTPTDSGRAETVSHRGSRFACDARRSGRGASL